MPRTKHSHLSFNSAYRRITHRERLVSQRDRNLLAERTHTTEEAALPEHRERALRHVSRAYALAAYAHAGLLTLLAVLFALAAFFFSRAIAGDILRKTRVRVDDIVTNAMQCARNLQSNGCVVDGDLVTHTTPALEALCTKWLACERRARYAWSDAASASIWAETLAETINSFMDRISSTSVLVAVFGGTCAVFLCSSAAFGFLHRRAVDDRVVNIPRIQEHDPIVSYQRNNTKAIAHRN